jgi:hypothetical protein
MEKNREPRVTLISLENDPFLELLIFFKDRNGKYMDPKFVVVLKYEDKDIMFIPALDNSQVATSFAYYSATEEGVVKKIDAGVYLLKVPKKLIDEKVKHIPEKLIFIVEHNNKVFEIVKILHI